MKKSKLILENFNFYIDTIIDAREEKNCIGAIQIGQDIIEPLFFENDFKTEMNYLFSPYLQKDSSKKPLIIKINRLFISNYKRANDFQSVAEMNITFLTKKNDQFLEYITIGKYRIGNKNKSKNIAILTSQIFLEFILKYNTGKLIPKIISSDSICVNSVKNKNYKIFDITRYPIGIYWSFEDFLDYTIDSITPFKYNVKYNSDMSSLIANIGFVNSDKSKNDLWGFSNGDNIFVNIEGKFYRIEKRNKDFVVIFPEPFNKGNIMLIPVILPGFIGAVFIFPTDSKYNSGDNYLDFSSSQFKPKYDLANCKAEAFNLFYYPESSKNQKRVKLFYNNKVICMLSPSQYYVLKTASDIKQCEIKFVCDSTQKSEIIFPQLFNIKMYEISVQKNQEINLKQLFYEQNESVSKKIKDGTLVNPCN